MMRNDLIPKLILTIVVLGFLFAGQPVEAVSTPVSEKTVNQETAERDDSKDLKSGQVAVPLNKDEIDSIAESLPEGEVRQMFNEKVATGAEKDSSSSDEDF